jgi:hypothetical protein
LNLKVGRRQLQSVKPGVQLQLNFMFELPDGYFLLQRTAKDARRFCREEGSEGRRDRKQEVETQAQTM